MAKRARFGRVLHYTGDKKPRENSPAGIRDADPVPGRIDLDSRMTAPTEGIRTVANTHDADLRHDYVWTKRSEKVAAELGIRKGVVIAGQPAHCPVARNPWALVSTAVSKVGRHPIKSMASQIAYAAKRDVGIEWEPKDIPTVEEFKRIFAAAERYYGPTWRKHFLVKRLKNIPGWKTCLSNAKKADPKVNTILINIGKTDPSTLPAYVDYYRR